MFVVLRFLFFCGCYFHHTIPIECNVYDLSTSNVMCFFLFLYNPPPPCSVLLWACASAFKTLLKSLSGLTVPSSASSCFVLDLPLMVTTTLNSYFFTVSFVLLHLLLKCHCYQNLNCLISHGVRMLTFWSNQIASVFVIILICFY